MVTRCPLGVGAPLIEIVAMIVNFGIIEQKTAVHFPLTITTRAVGALTLHTGLNSRNIYATHLGIKNACK